jgi:hypothetical protein
MQQYDVSQSEEGFSSHVRITCQPNRLPPLIPSPSNPGELVDVIEWKWHVTTNAKDQPTRSAASESGKVADFAQALVEAKAELARQYEAAGIPASHLGHLDHLG